MTNNKFSTFRNFLIVATCSLMVTGCSMFKPDTIVETKIERVEIPQSLIPQCDDVVFEGNTIGDVLQFNTRLLNEYQSCQDDVDALIEWNSQ